MATVIKSDGEVNSTKMGQYLNQSQLNANGMDGRQWQEETWEESYAFLYQECCAKEQLLQVELYEKKLLQDQLAQTELSYNQLGEQFENLTTENKEWKRKELQWQENFKLGYQEYLNLKEYSEKVKEQNVYLKETLDDGRSKYGRLEKKNYLDEERIIFLEERVRSLEKALKQSDKQDGQLKRVKIMNRELKDKVGRFEKMKVAYVNKEQKLFDLSEENTLLKSTVHCLQDEIMDKEDSINKLMVHQLAQITDTEMKFKRFQESVLQMQQQYVQYEVKMLTDVKDRNPAVFNELQLQRSFVDIKGQQKECTVASKFPIKEQQQECTVASKLPIKEQQQECTVARKLPIKEQQQEYTDASKLPIKGQQKECTVASKLPIKEQQQECTVASKLPIKEQQQECTVASKLPIKGHQQKSIITGKFPIKGQQQEYTVASKLPFKGQQKECTVASKLPIKGQQQEYTVASKLPIKEQQ
uniref:Uncharacterized protein n=2 Tax=Clytia hemisphaerica TaxID=252671 RepID=A0A7M5UGP8_9CNID